MAALMSSPTGRGVPRGRGDRMRGYLLLRERRSREQVVCVPASPADVGDWPHHHLIAAAFFAAPYHHPRGAVIPGRVVDIDCVAWDSTIDMRFDRLSSI